ncbi:MAG TPA: acetate/propionate family kinase [Gammaproteobacteria bacterium]
MSRREGASLLVVFNAGSSSLKFEVFDCRGGLRSVAQGAIRDIGHAGATLAFGAGSVSVGPVADAGEAAGIALDRLLGGLDGFVLRADDVAATGHRVVHGGDRFSAPVRVTVSVFDALKSLAPLAPLHNPQSLAVMQAVGERFPDVPLVAVFDTGFFHALPETARRYAIPAEWSERLGVRRYGFHGIAHEYLARQLDAAGGARRAVTIHLGQGCSMTALSEGRPVDTSMGFTPLEGLVMGTRSGDVDPGVILYLARQGLAWKELEDGLNRGSGLLGLSDASDDVRELLALESDGHAGARRALAIFCMRIRKYLGAYAAVLGGVDAIAFGGGIGENSAEIRARILADMEWLGVDLDAEANACASGRVGRISSARSAVAVHVFPVDEEPLIAAAALDVLRDATG